MSRDFLALHAGSNRGAPVTDANPVPVKMVAGEGPDGLATEDTLGDVKVATEAMAAAIAQPGAVQVALAQSEYETVAVSTTAVMGSTGAIGDYLAGVLIVPSSLSPGAVQIKDGGGTAITIFAGGASSLSNLVPFFVPLGIKATGAGWSVITLAGATAIGVGDFT